MMPKLKLTKDEKEVSAFLQEMIDGAIEELVSVLPDIEFESLITDAQIKQAILDITPEGTMKLYEQFGREPVMQFISEFSRGREW